MTESPSKIHKREMQRFHMKTALFHLRTLSPDMLPGGAVTNYNSLMRSAEMLEIDLAGEPRT